MRIHGLSERDNANQRPMHKLLETARYISKEHKTRTEFAFVCLLSAVAIAMRGACSIAISNSHHEHISMCTILNGLTGCGKTNSLKVTRRAISHLEKSLKEQYEAVSSGNQKIDTPQPSIRLTIQGNCTPQSLLSTLVEQSGSISIIDGEIGTLQSLLYKSNQRSWILQMLEGEPVENTTQYKGTIRVENPSIVILSATQPDTLLECVTRYKLNTNGFLARSFIIPSNSFLPPFDQPGSKIAPTFFENRLKSILDRASSDNSRPKKNTTFTLSPSAKSILDQYDQNKYLVNLGIRHPWIGETCQKAINSWDNRSTGHAARIAAIIMAYNHCLNELQIDEQSMQDAIWVINWLRECMLDACIDLFPVPGYLPAKKIAIHIGGYSYFHVTKLFAYIRNEMSRAEFDMGLAYLRQTNAIFDDTLPPPPGSKGGRPQNICRVNHDCLRSSFKPEKFPPKIIIQ